MVISNNSWENLNNEITACRKCQRLVNWREQVAQEKKRAFRECAYWGRGVPGFGDQNARVLMLGLAPGAHGSNRTGRMFTGDSSGAFLFPALYRAGFSNFEFSTNRNDSLILHDLFISAVCRCAPPGNKPTSEEINNCKDYFKREAVLLASLEGIVALGHIAFNEVLGLYKEIGIRTVDYKFGHGAIYGVKNEFPWLLASYHPSQQNTQTGRLTSVMFDEIWIQVRDLLKNQPDDRIYGR
jgi:uracil-DNA glycosylase family 4